MASNWAEPEPSSRTAWTRGANGSDATPRNTRSAHRYTCSGGKVRRKEASSSGVLRIWKESSMLGNAGAMGCENGSVCNR